MLFRSGPTAGERLDDCQPPGKAGGGADTGDIQRQLHKPSSDATGGALWPTSRRGVRALTSPSDSLPNASCAWRQMFWHHSCNENLRMVSTTCESCGQTIFPGVRTCPHCGAANRLDLKPLLQAAVPLLIGVLALGGLTVMCAPRTKTISCVYTNAPGTVVAEGSDPFTDDEIGRAHV